MKISIRTKLFFSLTALVLFFVILSLTLTLLGLEKFYIWQKKNILVANSQAVDDLYQGIPEEISLELERIGNTLGAGIVILTKEGYIKYSSFGRIVNQKFLDRLPPPMHLPRSNNTPDHPRQGPGPFRLPEIPLALLKEKEIINPQTTLEMQQDRDLKIDFIVLEHQLKNNDILIIRQPLAPVSESATVTAQFVAFTGLLSLLGGSIWAFFFARKFTQPMLELNRLAQSMSQLDFSQKYTINRSDEIGELGRNINHLSDQLDTAISDLNLKNQQLLADVEKERQLDKMRKDFVSSVSHELKTPLALLLGYAEGLKENVAHDEASKNYYCSVIIDEAEKMDKLIKDLLNLSQIESGLYHLNRTDFNLSLLIDDILQKYQTVLQEKNITLEVTKEPDLLVNGDSLRIEQIILNLLNNAIDHTEFTGTIRIWVTPVAAQFRFFVYNSGKPIPEDSHEKIWTSFYKVDKARTREHGGYGLGLSIVRVLQELHGNSYGSSNMPDGVTFWFDLTKVENS